MKIILAVALMLVSTVSLAGKQQRIAYCEGDSPGAEHYIIDIYDLPGQNDHIINVETQLDVPGGPTHSDGYLAKGFITPEVFDMNLFSLSQSGLATSFKGSFAPGSSELEHNSTLKFSSDPKLNGRLSCRRL